MKKIIILWGAATCMFFQYIKAQQTDINYGDLSRPVPTVSSLATYNNVSSSTATGLPEISIPLLKLPSCSKDIQLGLSLSYNLLNAVKDEPASDIGTGWSLFSGGVISRNIVGRLDEIYYDVTLSNYKKNQFDDIYYYNIPGVSGKFKFVRDITTNTFVLVNLSPTKVKIEYTHTSNTATLILNSFTITDTKGNKFFFNDYSLANLDSDPFAFGNNEYRSAFFLTRIVDANNIEMANFTYERKSKNKYYFPDQKLYEYCKLKTITSPGFGKIEYDYFFSEPWKMNDPYQVQKITLKDQDNHIISGYTFEYSAYPYEDFQLSGGPMEYIYKRTLTKIKKVDKNNTVSEITEFEYFENGSGLALKWLINPSGGAVQYDLARGRINTIKYYNAKTDMNPVKTTRYDYSSFIDANTSSGKSFFIEMDRSGNPYYLYSNVKVIEDNNGYTKYYYKTPDDFPQVPYTEGGATDKFWPYYSTVSSGLFEKKEVYDAQNRLLVTEESDYVFEDVPGATNYQLFNFNSLGSNGKTYSKSVWLKKLTNTSTSYFENGRSVQDRSETDFNIFNFETAKVSKMVEGSLEEKIFIYPETGYPNLAAANMVSIPVIVEEKIDGKLLSRTETKFTNPASVNPTVVVSSNIGVSAEKTVTIDLYDEKGNVIQYTSADGKKSTVIYGYYKTQPIATIEGATYAQVSGLIQNIVNTSDADAANPAKEPQLLTALDAFRNHDQMKDFRMTTYTYDPLIGATTVTSSNGMRETYKYDVRNRLEKVLDKDGMILKEYKYNYKN